ncbi:MAG TPA: 50S ribosomal protein L25 [Thermomicrobiales bacterium]|nr:50S ribosomal protein L25 [Thermomicrobiales bacterium]
MAQRHSLDAHPRTILGKETKKLRRQGIVPGVIYGPVISDPISVSVDMKELGRMYYAFGSNLLIDLSLDSSHYTVYMRSVTIDRLKRQPLHAEFYAPNMFAAITASIPVHLIGEPDSVTGVVTPVRETIDVRGLPDALPPSLEVDISGLAEYDDAIYLREMTIPEGVELLTDADEMLVKLAAPARISVDDQAIEDEAAAAAEIAAEAQTADEPEDDAESES